MSRANYYRVVTIWFKPSGHFISYIFLRIWAFTSLQAYIFNIMPGIISCIRTFTMITELRPGTSHNFQSIYFLFHATNLCLFEQPLYKHCKGYWLDEAPQYLGLITSWWCSTLSKFRRCKCSQASGHILAIPAVQNVYNISPYSLVVTKNHTCQLILTLSLFFCLTRRIPSALTRICQSGHGQNGKRSLVFLLHHMILCSIHLFIHPQPSQRRNIKPSFHSSINSKPSWTPRRFNTSWRTLWTKIKKDMFIGGLG